MSLMILQTIRSERPGESHVCRKASDLLLPEASKSIMLSMVGGRPVG